MGWIVGNNWINNTTKNVLVSVSRYSNTIANTTAILGILAGVYVSCSSGTHLWGFNVTVVSGVFYETTEWKSHGLAFPLENSRLQLLRSNNQRSGFPVMAHVLDYQRGILRYLIRGF